jgi:UDP-N-acetylglucosamine diphosphorylase / glucose-1-phosphate thymidylyltransferase / UDP-N-acetylgalactosamine diphosphorylase / glucosamine-1-phosphate N-acetyltransferase / galactosamine-1-phosphate N-acetyltransferase
MFSAVNPNVVVLKMNFYDDPHISKQLFPFTLTRSAADIRIGITTIREKWAALDLPAHQTTPSHLIPTPATREAITAGQPIDFRKTLPLEFPWHIFMYNDQVLRDDFKQLTAGRRSEPIPSSNRVIARENIFLEEGAKVEHCILNAATGPIYIGRNAEVMEGSMIRGSFALCEGGLIKMGAKIYGATTIGPYSVAGGELKNIVIFANSNKAHDGYLGDSVIGEWCNLGAGTTNSNLKNTATEVKVWNPASATFNFAGLKCGLLMGDYSRSAINTCFNTGTVVGVCCNVFGEGLTPKYIPSFTWGYNEPRHYALDKALRDIDNWKKFKNQSLSEAEINKLNSIFGNLKNLTE